MSKLGSQLKAKASNMISKVGGIKGKIASAAIKSVNLKNLIKKKLKFYLICTCGIFLLVSCIVMLMQSLFKNTSVAASYKISSPEFKSKADARALSLYEKYNSYLGFTLSEIEEISNEACESVKSNNDGYTAYTSKKGLLLSDKKNKISDAIKDVYDENGNIRSNLSEANIALIQFYKTSKEGKFNNIITENDNLPMFTHVLNSEKYQFNNIKWMAYTHSGGAAEVSKDGFKYDENLGLIYPSAGNPDVYKFMEMVSPYLMSSTIPSSYLSQSIYSAQNRTSMGSSVTDEYYKDEYGITSDVGNFAYQVIKHGKSNVTINQYNLQTQSVTSSWEEYNDYTCKDSFKIIKESTTGKYYDSKGNYVSGHDGETKTTYRLVVDSYQDGSDKHDDDNKGASHNSRLNEETQQVEYNREKVVEKPSPIVNIQYKLSNALAFDVNVNNSYDYKTYSDDDVSNLINANTESGITPQELKRVSSSTNQYHYTLEQLQNMTSEQLGELVNSLNKTNVQVVHQSSENLNTWDDGTRWDNITTTEEITLTGNEYVLEYGNTNYITRTWSDSLSADPTSSKKTKLGISNLVEFNKNSTNDYSKNTITSDDLKADTDSLAYFTSLTKKDQTALNIVDILDSNPKIYKTYMSGANARYKYAGYGRSEYTVSKGNSLIKSEFNKLAENNNSSLPFVYGESFGFNTGAEEPSNSMGSSSGKRLMYEYIYQLEGTGTMKEENGVKYYQVYTINGNRTVGHGLDLETSGKESDLIELANRSGYSITTEKGAWIPADIVDAILDQEIENWYSIVVSKTSGLNLKEYQIYALTSRALNCGYNFYKAYNTSPANGNIDLIAAYNTYWHSDTDDKYEKLAEQYGSSDIMTEQENEILNNVDYNHGLFSSYLAGPNNGGQLDNRRKSEWVLFQTGYFGYNTNIKKFYSESGGSIVECAEYVHAYMEENNYTYCVYGGNSYEECGTFGKSHGLDPTFEESKSNHQNTCCATFVSWVLQEAGYMTAEEHTRYGCNGAINIANFLENQKGWTRVDPNQMEAGDVMVYTYGHVQLYAGDGTTYNAGSGEAIRKDSPYKGYNTPNYALRAPN